MSNKAILNFIIYYIALALIIRKILFQSKKVSWKFTSYATDVLYLILWYKLQPDESSICDLYPYTANIFLPIVIFNSPIASFLISNAITI